jgi:outer membrane protein assembly factor BamE (lipoprotein component of BamABCDE complex)
MTGRMRRGCLLPIFVALMLSGCVPIPIPALGYSSDSRTNLADRVPESIVNGKTTRADVLLALGVPDLYAPDGGWMVYRSARHTGGVAFVAGGGYTAGVVGAINSYENRLLVVRFDANSIVVDVALENETCRGVNQAACSAIPGFSEDSTDSGSTFLNFPPYESSAQAVAAASPEKATLQFAPVRDARSIARGKLIGQRSSLGTSMGKIDMSPSPVAMIRQVLVAELGTRGYRSVEAGADIAIDARLTRFEVRTPSTALYWDINGAIAIDVDVRRSSDEPQRFHYESTCTDRTYVWPSQSVVGNVVLTCLTQLGTRVREDHALVQSLAVHRRASALMQN